MRKKLPSVEHIETLSLSAMRKLVGGFVSEMQELKAEVAELRTENASLRDNVASLELENRTVRIENQELRDEIARLKNLPPRPPFRPSGMEKATQPNTGKSDKRGPRGAKRDRNRITRQVTLASDVPDGSRFKGYKDILVRELVLGSEVVRYRRERWVTPQGKLITAPMPDGIIGSYGPNLRRFCLALHAQGQVTTERLTSILQGIGIEISKSQVVRILMADLEIFVEEDAAVLHAGLLSAPIITVDDTGAKHQRHDGITTQIGGDRFTAFRTGSSKSRLNFLSLLRGGYNDYVFNDAAVDYLHTRGLEPSWIEKLDAHSHQVFESQTAFLHHLSDCSIDIFDKARLRLLSEAAIWGSIRHHGLLGNTVIVSDDAGQFRVANHALCWVHAERLVQKLMPATSKQVRSVEMIRDLIWCFYKALKVWKQRPSPGAANAFRRRFDKIFTLRTGYDALDQLLGRLHKRKDELLKVLERPEIPLHTNAAENDLRACVTKRKISGGTMSIRAARHVTSCSA
jgi:FtsZ-binding cell division protein ZapB